MVKTDQINYVADYSPYGKLLREFVSGEKAKYLTIQHERDTETGLDYRGARYYDSDIARFLSVDPWADKYPGWSTYSYVMGNPITLTDPTGKGVESTDVKKNEDGSYTVVGAKNDGDHNIYLTENGKRTGEIIGRMENPWDFMQTSKTGGFDKYVPITFNLNKLPNANEIMDKYAKEWKIAVTTFQNSIAATAALAALSRNNGRYDIKSDFKSAYRAVSYNGKITTI